MYLNRKERVVVSKVLSKIIKKTQEAQVGKQIVSKKGKFLAGAELQLSPDDYVRLLTATVKLQVDPNEMYVKKGTKKK